MVSPDPRPRPGSWPEALDLLERTLLAEDEPDDRWFDASLGPIPVELIPRAREIIRRQRDALARLAAERRTIELHLTALKSIPTTRTLGGSVYLDTTS